ncbi:helix-turn-helix transcriptional regulator [Butyricimonas virosa]|uniref:S24 family peptidase n=1 Tax=Butyricimonas virosa TaxID=544645 RepID=UPI00307B3332
MTFPQFNESWLLTGEGKMLKDDPEIPHMEALSIGIPHIEFIEAYCGPGQGFDVAVMRKECPMYNIPGMEGADFTIKAKGRSMINREYPDRSVKEGDYIGCVKCRSGVIRFGEVYALATSEGIMVKIVQESDREGYVLLESFNKEEGFKPFHYPIVDIHDMALVVAVASINRWA